MTTQRPYPLTAPPHGGDTQAGAPAAMPALAKALPTAEPAGRGRGARPECGSCTRCELVPALAADGSTLWLWPPRGHTLAKVQRTLARAAIPFQQGWRSGALVVATRCDTLEGAIQRVAAHLSSAEARDTRALLMRPGEIPRAHDIARVVTLPQLRAQVEGAWLARLLAEERIVTYAQPIVSADEGGELYGYEALLRGIAPDGGLIPPLDILAAAEASNNLFAVDLAARRCAIRTAAAHGLRAALFINFNPNSVYDPVYCLRSTHAALRDSGLRPEQIVFEISEASAVQDPAHLRSIIAVYRSYGFRFAIDDMGTGFASFSLLHEVRPDIIKFDRSLVQGVHQSPYKSAILKQLLGLTRELGAASVVEGIEVPEELAWARAHGATFVQGFLLGRPAPLTARETARPGAR